MAKDSGLIVLEKRLVKSRAWLSLTGAATQVFLLFRTKCQVSKRYGKPGRHDRVILNNGEIEFTYLEAEKKYGISKDRFARALDQLIDRGFIDVKATGMGVHKVKSWYAISTRWRDYGTPAFCEAKRPKPSIRNAGFKRGNQLGRMARRKKSSGENPRGAVRENARGETMTVREDARGDGEPILHNRMNDKELACEVAQVATTRENNTVL